MTHFDYDYFVIGAGSAGIRSARIAKTLGAKVGIAEASALGGTCVNLGCVPKKMFSYAADHYKHIKDASGYGWVVSEPKFNWETLRNNKDAAIQRTNNFFDRMLKENEIDLYRGHAKFTDTHSLDIEGTKVTAKHIAIATGGQPRMNTFSGSEHAIVSDDAFSLANLPDSIVIYGGGYVAVEFAHIYEGLGVDVTLIYRGDMFLRGFDQEIATYLANEMEKQGIKVLFNTQIENLSPAGNAYEVKLSTGETLTTGLVFSALGRIPKIDNLGLENIDVQLDERGYVQIDDNFQTTTPHVYALGDITGKQELTPVAIRHGHQLAHHLFDNHTGDNIDYAMVPTAIFSRPEIGTCGYSEEDAIKNFGAIDIYTSSFRPLKYSLPQREESTFMKLIVARESNQVIGLHVAGLDSAEILQGFAVAMQMGATKADFDKTVAIHPSSAEEFVTMKTPTRSHG